MRRIVVHLNSANAADDGAGRFGIVFANRLDPFGDGGGGIGAIGAVAGEQLVQNHTERVDVGRSGDGIAAKLLGTGVIRRERALPRLGDVFRNPHRHGIQKFCDSEIEQHRYAFGCHQNVRRLEIAMHDQALMRVVHGAAHADEQVQSIGHAELVRFAITIDVLAFDVIDDQIGKSVGRGTAVDKPDDLRMIERSQGLAFDDESAHDFQAVHAWTDQLDSDSLTELVVAFGEIDLAHAAFADAFDQPVIADDAGFRHLYEDNRVDVAHASVCCCRNPDVELKFAAARSSVRHVLILAARATSKHDIQLASGFSTRSMMSTSTSPLEDSNFRPSC